MEIEKRIVDTIRDQAPHLKSGSLIVFGNIFGGRIDNIHTAIDAEVSDAGSVIVHFDLGERLEIWDPDGYLIDRNNFRIARAARIRWEWPYYGRSNTRANLRYIEHVRTGDHVRVTSNAEWAATLPEGHVDRPAVELVSAAQSGVASDPSLSE